MSGYQIGQEVEGIVEAILPFGVFLRLRDRTKAYIRRRELALEPDVEPARVTWVGEQIKAIVIGLEKTDKCLELSRRDLLEDGWDDFLRNHREGSVIEGVIGSLHPHGVFVRLRPGIRGFVPLDELSEEPVARPEDLYWVADRVEAVVTQTDQNKKKVWLSIKARLRQRRQALAVFDQVGPRTEEAEDVAAAVAAAFTGEMITPEVCLSVGPILVVEDHAEMRDSLTAWLKQHGCEVGQAGTLAEGLSLVSQKNWGLILADLNLFDCDGLELVRHAKKLGSQTHICVMSTPDSLAKHAAEIEQVEVSEVLPKPLDLADLEQFFLHLAGGEAIKPWRARHTPESDPTLIFPELALLEDSEKSPLHRLKTALYWVTKNMRAQAGMIFCLDPVSRAITVLAQTEGAITNQEAFYGLRESPVKDVIGEGKPVVENRAGNRGRARFARLLDYLSFESCLGVPIKVHGEVQHAAFFFHREPERFQRDSLRDAYAGAALFSALLTEDAVSKRLQTMHPMLLSGELGAGFGHEVANKISGLEIQVLNLLRKCEGQERLKLDSTRVLGLVLDMKDTVEAFQQLSRTNLPHGDIACDLDLVLQRAETLLQPVARRDGVRIDRRLSEGLPKVAGSVITLQQIFLNLMLNAVQQMALKADDHRVLSISTSLGEGQLPLQVRFWDSGPGIHRQLWEKIFSPGFSTRGGSGLGLFIARSFANSLGGRLSVEESFVPLGTTMLVELPAADEGGVK